MMKNWLKSNHIELIDIKINDHYDPNFMEAIDTVKDNDSTDYKVVKIIENGYKLHDRIIRPAKVIVSNKKM
ncbi:MAG: nucleotide exchange factor GrpE [Malacoplasma sp.]|nr:nucleotide exchange factor GrpE [Malacoplasma sp.]